MFSIEANGMLSIKVGFPIYRAQMNASNMPTHNE
jgi:hypothetical protein